MTTTETQSGGANRHQRSVGDVSGLASCQVWEAGSGHCGESSKHLRKFRVGTLNVNTLRGRVCEVVETLSRRKVDVCCIQDTRYLDVEGERNLEYALAFDLLLGNTCFKKCEAI